MARRCNRGSSLQMHTTTHTLTVHVSHHHILRQTAPLPQPCARPVVYRRIMLLCLFTEYKVPSAGAFICCFASSYFAALYRHLSRRDNFVVKWYQQKAVAVVTGRCDVVSGHLLQVLVWGLDVLRIGFFPAFPAVKPDSLRLSSVARHRTSQVQCGECITMANSSR